MKNGRSRRPRESCRNIVIQGPNATAHDRRFRPRFSARRFRMSERQAPQLKAPSKTMADQTIETLTEKARSADRGGVAAGPGAGAAAPILPPRTASCGPPIPAFWSRCQRVNRVDIGLIRGIDRVRDILIDNTRRFAAGLPANNALLWGARGMGKSSLVKAVHAAINASAQGRAAAQADRDPPRGHRHAAEAAVAAEAGAVALHPVLRRPLVRPRRHLLQIAEGGARGRRRRPARPM